MTAVPRTAQLWRLAASREVILSGFQQELYAPEEKPIAYWYLSRVLEVHLCCIDGLLPVVPRGTSIANQRGDMIDLSLDTAASRELNFQKSHLTALQLICIALVSVWRIHRVPFRRLIDSDKSVDSWKHHLTLAANLA